MAGCDAAVIVTIVHLHLDTPESSRTFASAKINLDCLRSRGIEQSNLLWCDWRCIKSESVARCFGDKTEHSKTLHWP